MQPSCVGLKDDRYQPRRPRLAWRIALGCAIVLLASAATTAVFGLDQIHKLRVALSQNPSLSVATGALTPTGFGDPQTLLLVGNDQREHTTTTPVLPHSNEMLLVRIDPSKPWISMMSIPRELEVTIQCPNGPVTTRLNYALTCDGSFTTLVSTIEQLTGLSVNHVVMIDFNNFKRAVDEIGCVYSTIDERYYHVNTPGSQQYQEINLQPGYQDLCGAQALQFVSYRHDDSSLVRDARDQSFLLDVKKQYGPTLVDNLDKFERIFGQSVQTDAGLHTTTGIEDLLGTLISAASLRVRQVQFQVTLQPNGSNPCNCDIATPQQVSASVDAFLYGGSSLPKHSTAAVAQAVHNNRVAAALPLVATPAQEVAQAGAAGARAPFPYEYPRVQDKGGSVYPVDLRDYLIHPPGGAAFPIYVAVFATGQLGQYYDVQGTTWTGAPLFDNPDQTVSVGGRTYDLYYEGQHIETVAWHEHGAVYWVRNTLLDSVGNGELLAIAEQTAPVITQPTGSAHQRLALRAATVPVRHGASQQTSLTQTLGALGGLMVLCLVPVLAIPLIKRRRQLAEIRTQLAASLHAEARLTSAANGVARRADGVAVRADGVGPGAHGAAARGHDPARRG